MSSRIILLQPDTIDKIAAGEVVERPVSALKELIENALDAESTRVVISLKQGGIKQIKVVDDGWGMNPEEVRRSVERHATSKITHADDLQRLLSFGFRGEALSSMAAVTHLEVISRTQEQTEGTRLSLSGGELINVEPVGAPVGTQVTLRDLFYNLPVRRKFLRSPGTEQRLALDLVSRLVLANPQVAFQLQCDDQIRLRSSGNNNLLEAVAMVYGPETARQLLVVNRDLTKENSLTFSAPLQGSEIMLWGYISNPGLTRNNRRQQSFFVNRRWVRSRLLQEAVMEAYHGLLAAQRYPLVILHLVLPPEKVDVNIHPGKMEIRFQDERQVFDQTVKNLRAALRTDGVIRRLEGGGEKPIAPKLPPAHSLEPCMDPGPSVPMPGRLKFSPPPVRMESTPDLRPTLPIRPDTLAEAKVAYGEKRFAWELLVPKAQMMGTYIMAEGPDGLYILDQHAVHERILYEKIMDSLSQEENYSQAVLFPETLELTPEENETFTRNVLFFRKLGFVLEHFGGKTFILRSLPTFIKTGGKQVFRDLLDGLMEKHHLKETDLYEEMVARLACHQAIRANRVLDEAEMETLILQLAGLKNPYSCPHGRPTVLRFTQTELERRFQRR